MTINHKTSREYARATTGENELSEERIERERQRFLNYFGVDDPQDDPDPESGDHESESLSAQSSSDEDSDPKIVEIDLVETDSGVAKIAPEGSGSEALASTPGWEAMGAGSPSSFVKCAEGGSFEAFCEELAD